MPRLAVRKPATLEQATALFLAKVHVPDSSSATCWPWLGSVNRKTGYGQVWWGGRSRPAHRVAVLLADGEWPPTGTVVRHLCGRRDCVRPAHLRVGTVQENADDRVRHREEGVPAYRSAVPRPYVQHRYEPAWVRNRSDLQDIGPGSCGRLPTACAQAVDGRCVSPACVWAPVGC